VSADTLTPEQLEHQRREQLAKVERDGRLVERLAARVTSGQSGKSGRARVELHVDIADMAVLVKLARAQILGSKRVLERGRKRKPADPIDVLALIVRLRAVPMSASADSSSSTPTSLTLVFDAFIETLGLPDDQRAALLRHRGILQNAFAAGWRVALDMLESKLFDLRKPAPDGEVDR
jgi:hypothetical protein